MRRLLLVVACWLVGPVMAYALMLWIAFRQPVVTCPNAQGCALEEQPVWQPSLLLLVALGPGLVATILALRRDATGDDKTDEADAAVESRGHGELDHESDDAG
jgi:hypothetical protein